MFVAVNLSGDSMLIRRFTSPDLFARIETTSNRDAGPVTATACWGRALIIRGVAGTRRAAAGARGTLSVDAASDVLVVSAAATCDCEETSRTATTARSGTIPTSTNSAALDDAAIHREPAAPLG